MTDTQVRADEATGGGTRLFGSGGRHRRPRPRKVLFAAGGIALAAGVLSLVRLAPESGVGGIGTAEAEPGLHPGDRADRPKNAAATLAASPIPSATSVMGGESATPTVVPVPTATTSPTAAPGVGAAPGPTTIPEAPNATPTTAPRAPATTAPAPQPTPTATQPPAPAPTHTTAPQPAPHPTTDPGLCVPIVGVCVGLLSH
ncbi:hypothetical protein [Streptomyces pseudovenezuelae]|uniref:Outer membrane biosynthesis protein TonB n=1 Tax=Streptomyces pseudovenezuelae TaxID=67350 RepID=A0ABT6LPK6_9ACTN|nr:hypothetical protein [Streptomyces pseudovenezuelae]MDH6217304.1 outer membrane biosynthesis protein TonB [Streptomyces pseudovenezuelae]